MVLAAAAAADACTAGLLSTSYVLLLLVPSPLGPDAPSASYPLSDAPNVERVSFRQVDEVSASGRDVRAIHAGRWLQTNNDSPATLTATVTVTVDTRQRNGSVIMGWHGAWLPWYGAVR